MCVFAGGSANRINTGTFTRPKTKISTESGDRSAENVDKHPDVTDIENLAKQQEESKGKLYIFLEIVIIHNHYIYS